ncbi:hypothetical protein CANINC_003910 [Pichia inconspicua]|uniref:B30.2/SPRY domain-containing protein n=1 Tax=Pichia inconspicua TaxID=52247 RepID=A0A4T0WXJ1_9ASCO|nr:hypothetical protein CANINC_003910 [[Candida] inconspicua]
MDQDDLRMIIIETVIFILITVIFFLLGYVIYIFYISDDDDLELQSNDLPSSLKLDFDKYTQLRNYEKFQNYSTIEKLTYLLTIAFNRFNKPNLIPIKTNSTQITTESLLIRDRGINAFYFKDYFDSIQQCIELLENENDETNEFTSLIKTEEELFKSNRILELLKIYNYEQLFIKKGYTIEDLIEIEFSHNCKLQGSVSTILNLPIPTNNRKNNVTYFECKLLEFNEINDFISIGLVSNPNYPTFQLPGFIPYSFAIESNGNLRITNKNGISEDLIVLQNLNKGDIIGFGFRSTNGTIFLTHNGKLIHQLINNFKFELYPCIGYKRLNETNSNCKINVNLGQLGFVYIEGNVKKLGFCEDKNEGLIGAPPIYNKINLNNEILLDKGDDIPPNYPNESFFTPIVSSSNFEKKIRLTPESEPPSYESEKDLKSSKSTKNVKQKNKKGKGKGKGKRKGKNKTSF